MWLLIENSSLRQLNLQMVFLIRTNSNFWSHLLKSFNTHLSRGRLVSGGHFENLIHPPSQDADALESIFLVDGLGVAALVDIKTDAGDHSRLLRQPRPQLVNRLPQTVDSPLIRLLRQRA